MSDRHIVVVDTETTGLDPELHVPVEIAWWDLSTDKRGCFVPNYGSWPHVISEANAEALEINGFYDRIWPRVVGRSAEEADGEAEDGFAGLVEALQGNTFAGSNPTFDASMIQSCAVDSVWHHRLLDLAAYAAGVLSIPPTRLPGLNSACKELGIENVAPHTAAGDVDATGRCFLALMEIADRNNPMGGQP